MVISRRRWFAWIGVGVCGVVASTRLVAQQEERASARFARELARAIRMAFAQGGVR